MKKAEYRRVEIRIVGASGKETPRDIKVYDCALVGLQGEEEMLKSAEEGTSGMTARDDGGNQESVQFSTELCGWIDTFYYDKLREGMIIVV